MTKDLEKRDQEFEQCVIALTTVLETVKVASNDMQPPSNDILSNCCSSHASLHHSLSLPPPSPLPLPQRHQEEYSSQVVELAGEFSKIKLPAVAQKYLPKVRTE